MSKILEFKEANLPKLEAKWELVENKAEYTPCYQAGKDAGFTHFIASEFVNHNNQSKEYVNV